MTQENQEQKIREELKNRAKALGLQGYGNMTTVNLKKAVDEAMDKRNQPEELPKEFQETLEEKIARLEVELTEARSKNPEKHKVNEVRSSDTGLFPFTDPKTGRIGLFEKIHKKSEVSPFKADRKISSSYRLVRWHS